MSRTYRKIQNANVNARKIKYKSARVAEQRGLDELIEHQITPRNRYRKLASRWYLDSRDDYYCAAYNETRYLHNKVLVFLEGHYGYTRKIRNWNYTDYEYYFKKFEDENIKKCKRIDGQELIEEIEESEVLEFELEEAE